MKSVILVTLGPLFSFVQITSPKVLRPSVNPLFLPSHDSSFSTEEGLNGL